MGLEEVPLMAVIRIRGRVDIKPDIRHTLDMLHIKRKFWATVVPLTPSYKGMLHKVKDYTTYGEIDRDTLIELLRSRGELAVGGKLTDEWLKENTEFSSIDELVDAVMRGKVKLHKLGWLKPYFRLTPPKGGFKRTTKRSWNDGGELGYRGEEINKLLRRMI
ncbi:MAG TPA: 50S ribosomal protein L30 [Candidatus Korarchaeota archaeon]|nr:50S ribosomal protein L30 [Candidatus Korarchaeota archaeon]